MLTYEQFTGVNNVQQPERLGSSELTAAVNVDIGLSGEVFRRAGYTEVSPVCHRNLFQANGFLLATRDGGELVAITDAGTTSLHPNLGAGVRVWYCQLPDGRVTFSNGLIHGVTDGLTATDWGVPVPPGIGELTPVAGQLNPGDYQYQVTYVRLTDSLEGAPAYSNPIPVPDGGVLIQGLPQREGFAINVYLSGANGDSAHLAGSTLTDSFSYLGSNDALVLPCRTDFLAPPPVGILQAFWRGRVLTAVGSVLYASRPASWELFDLRRDFKQMAAPITLVQPVEGGIFVGTNDELAFLDGTEFDKLVRRQIISGPVVLGSGVLAPGNLVKRADTISRDPALVCIADRLLVAGYSDGAVERLTESRYETDATEVCATFRKVDGVPQYIAIPQ